MPTQEGSPFFLLVGLMLFQSGRIDLHKLIIFLTRLLVYTCFIIEELITEMHSSQLVVVRIYRRNIYIYIKKMNFNPKDWREIGFYRREYIAAATRYVTMQAKQRSGEEADEETAEEGVGYGTTSSSSAM